MPLLPNTVVINQDPHETHKLVNILERHEKAYAERRKQRAKLTKGNPPNKKQRGEDDVPTYVSADPAHDCDGSGDLQEAELTIDSHEITALYSEMESSSPPPPREKLSTPLIISRG